MAKVRENINFGDEESITIKSLIAILDEAYRDLAIAVNKKPDLYYRASDGQTSDSFMSDGDININSGTAKVEIITDHPTPSTVTWTTL